MNTDNNFELSVSRTINASPEIVWQIMTERLPEWWCPKPWRTEVNAIEWRAGGRFDTTMIGPEPDQISAARGVILEVIPGKRLVFTDALSAEWNPQPAFMVGVFELQPEGEGVRYTASARHWSEEAMQQHRDMGFDEGWGTVAEQLAALAETGN